MKASDFDYRLPPELIAQHPARERRASRLMHVDARAGLIAHHHFSDVIDLIGANDLLVLNNTRVIKARLHGEKDTGGQVEVLIERILSDHEALAHVRASKPPKPGTELILAHGQVWAAMVAREDDLFRLRFHGDTKLIDILERHGEVPLPPYITHEADATDESRYQTVYAKQPGSVAAPTAGLHFDERLLDSLRAKGVRVVSLTLHVGAGTFRPLRDDDVSKHVMHSEWFDLPQAVVDAVSETRGRRGHVVAVGTTSVRTLEACAYEGELEARSGETQLFIKPGFRFNVVDRMITNFHLPKSTLLMLVSAFSGRDTILAAYEIAVQERYRFFSYGDAMLLERA